ncbi:MAG TPA: arsenite methyltransferase [Ktedonobacteraceae bacterium]|nr:arsenite methyltransferase [Ktedonobacteraceae bacterium]
MTQPTQDGEQLREAVRERYGQAALQVLSGNQTEADACCGPGCCGTGASSDGCCTTASGDAITSNLYSSEELGTLPVAAALASLGCGNPTALAELKPGEKVLDLGSGGGIDVLLSAKRVGPTGFAYGLDMTDAMLELAERNRLEAGVENARFLKGVIEAIPLPDGAVDVVISNCVINLSADKGQVLREAYRVLAPGGRFAVSDIVIQGELPEPIQRDLEAWAGCIAGALEESTYRRLLAEAGFVNIEVEVTRHYSVQDVADSGASAPVAALSEAERSNLEGKFASAFIRARKP